MLFWEVPDEVSHVNHLRFSPSGLFLATVRNYANGEGESVLRLWDALRGVELSRLDNVGQIVTVAFVSDRQLLVVVWERPVKGNKKKDQCLIWDADTGDLRPVGNKLGQATSGVVMSDGKTLVLVSGSEIVVLDSASEQVHHRLQAPWNTGINYDDMTIAGPYLAASCREDRDDYAVGALWDVQRGKRLHTYELDTGQIFVDALAVCERFRRLAFAFSDKIHAFGMDYEDPLEGFKPFRYKSLSAMRYAPDGGTLEVICQDGLVRLDPATGAVLEKWKLPSQLEWTDAVAFDPSGAKVALTDGKTVELLDLPT